MKCDLNSFIILFSIFSHTIIADEPVICGPIDIRNEPNEFHRLDGCTMINGSLSIVLIEKYRSTDFSQYQFPKLRVITGYLILHRVNGLKTLRHMLPNLAIIKGEQLLYHYALILYQMFDMVEIGLKSLVKIQQGYVLIRTCPRLCFTDTIDWNELTPPHIVGGWGTHIHIKPPKECPTIKTCTFCGKNGTCWNDEDCQRFDDGYSYDKKIKCHPQCLGGCSGETAFNCTDCRNYLYKGECIDKCPADTIILPEIHACITNETCIESHRIPFEGECRIKCPPNYTQFDPNASGLVATSHCFPCYTNCKKECRSEEIHSISDTYVLEGCQVIIGDLYIKLRSGMVNTMEILNKNLGDIEEIGGWLQVYQSPAITSLRFFRNLETIHGTKLGLQNYSIYIAYNDNLQFIWDTNEKKKFEILNGNLLFHDNRKLCINTILGWNSTVIRPPNTTIHDFVNRDTNGNDETCTTEIIKTNAVVISHSNVSISWNTLTTLDKDTEVGYNIYYIEAPEKNITYRGIDSCLVYGWKMQNATSVVSGKFQRIMMTDLMQNTQYAYYINAQVILKGPQHNLTNAVQGQSKIMYFVTFPAMPSPPIVNTLRKTESYIAIQWITIDEKEVIDYFLVDIFRQPDEQSFLDSRNYCLHPRVEIQPQVSIAVEQPQKATRNCKKRSKSYEFDNNDIDDESYDDSYDVQYGFGYDTDNDVNRQSNKGDCSQYSSSEESAENEQCNSDDSECNKRHIFRFKREMDNILAMHTSIFNEEPTRRITKRDISNAPNYVREIRFEKDVRDAIIDDLHPYTLYTFQFFSCNNAAGCSPYYMYNERTKSSEHADNMTFELIIDSVEVNTVHLEFDEPKMPNGLTVAFHIEQLDSKNSSTQLICITRRDHYLNDKRYTFRNLHVGQHGFRVRSISLAMDGHFTDFKYLDVHKSQSWHVTLVVTLIGFFIVLLCGSIGIYIYRKYHTKTPQRVQIFGSRQNILENEILPETLFDEDPFYIHREDIDYT